MNYFNDGDQVCCVEKGFVNLQVNQAGFGDNKEQAFINFCESQGKYFRFKHPTASLGIDELNWYIRLMA